VRVLVAAHRWDSERWVKLLRRSGLAADEAGSVAAVAMILEEAPYDAVVIDNSLARGSGLDVRSVRPETAVLVVTEPSAVEQRTQALRDGAEDALTPPFPAEELVLRVCQALVRRTEPDGDPQVRLGRVVFDRVTREVAVGDERVRLTPAELCIFDHLVAFRYRPVSEAELLDHCWGRDLDLFTDPLRSHLYRLRKRFAGDLIISHVNGAGFRLLVDDDGCTEDRSATSVG